MMHVIHHNVMKIHDLILVWTTNANLHFCVTTIVLKFSQMLITHEERKN